ncbi:uncharacterized protein H6S33_007646 [Morchella sextelata]|uniref:uncharacterized protein n=1 Tax=Morchella sextelata TaxID=1174677 RepID=UPI001D039A1F|nr:uncharacterized protein H6S33_007646 [Morchella sextelata]KAH0603324.1 hypothetical protein H6S33_007646 [Morchella sextelata]
MRSSTLYLALIACVASSASATYTNGDDFFNDLPTCIQKCNSVIIDNVKALCDNSSNSLQCICTGVDGPNAINETVSNDAAACSLKCSEDDQNALMKLGLDMASSCVPYLDGEDSSDNSTSSSMSGTATATKTAGASSTGGSMSTMTATASGSGSGSATQSPSSTASGAPAATGAAGQLVLGGALLIPALLAGLMI